jgi:hypothetical protein
LQTGEASRSGLDGGACLVEELADVAEALADRLRANVKQGGDGDLGQGVAVVQDGGQEPVGQGEDGAAACARGGEPGAVAAALGQAGLSLAVVQRHQGSDQGVPPSGRQPGQCRVAEPGQAGAGLVEGAGPLAGWSGSRGRRACFQSPCSRGRRV